MNTGELYDRGAQTLLASWEAYAAGASDAILHQFAGVATAVFPDGPERSIYNNALLDRDLPPAVRAEAIAAMEAAYAAVDVTRFAAWVHESDAGMRSELERRGYRVDEVTRAMGMTLDEIRVPRPELDVASADWSEHLRIAGVPLDLLSGFDAAQFHVVVARRAGESVSTGLAFDCGGDCGIYNVGTLEPARRRGFGTALTAVQLHDAVARGCRTASLQSTAMAERVYATVGFRDLGRFLEYVPRQPEDA